MSNNSFLPDIDEYLESLNDNLPVSIKDLDDIINIIIEKTDLNEISAKIITKLIFQEIRNAMLRNEIVSLRKFGKFYISSPIGNKNKVRVFPKFVPSKNLLKKLKGV